MAEFIELFKIITCSISKYWFLLALRHQKLDVLMKRFLFGRKGCITVHRIRMVLPEINAVWNGRKNRIHAFSNRFWFPGRLIKLGATSPAVCLERIAVGTCFKFCPHQFSKAWHHSVWSVLHQVLHHLLVLSLQ